jgi:hypothetical protein
MAKKFYLVKNETDPMTGGIIPYKVLNYYPSSYAQPFAQPYAQPFIQPMPITKSPGLSLSLSSNTLPNFPSFPNPYGPQINLTGKPFKPQIIGATSTLYSPFGNPISGMSTGQFAQNTQSMYGAPIIKYGPLAASNMPGTIKILFGNNIASINIPLIHFRNVINDIYSMALSNLNPNIQNNIKMLSNIKHKH